MQANTHSSTGNEGTSAARKGASTVNWNEIFEVVGHSYDGTIIETVLDASVVLISTLRSKNYEATESIFFG